MKGFTEKRASKRCNYEAPVTCAYFNSDRFYRAKTINHSRDGMYFESNFPLRLGSNIYIRVESFQQGASRSEDCDCGGVRMLSLGEVKWCEEVFGSYGSYYKVGLKFVEPAV